jgi:hypothetical protein
MNNKHNIRNMSVIAHVDHGARGRGCWRRRRRGRRVRGRFGGLRAAERGGGGGS